MKKSILKKSLSLFLAILMALSALIPTGAAFAEGNEQEPQATSTKETPSGRQKIDKVKDAVRMPKTIANFNNDPAWPTPGAVKIDEQATWVDDPNGDDIAKVTLTVEGKPKIEGTDVILIMDTSLSMEDEGRMDAAKQSAKNLTRSIYGDVSPGVASENRMALIDFNDYAFDGMPLTPNQSGIIDMYDGVIDGLTPMGLTNYGDAFDIAAEVIEQRNLVAAEATRPLHVVFLTDGEPQSSTEWNTSVNKIKNDYGAKIHTVGLSLDAKDITNPAEAKQRLEDISSGAGFYHLAKEASELTGVFDTIGKNIKIAGTKATITNTMGSRFNFITGGSYDPSFKDYSIAGDKLTIDVGDITSEKKSFEYYISLKAGTPTNNRYPVNEEAYIDYTNYLDKKFAKNFVIPKLAYPGGQIEIVSFLSDANGNAVSKADHSVTLPDNNEDTIFNYGVVLETKYHKEGGNDLLPFGSYTVTPDPTITADAKVYSLNGTYAGNKTLDVKASDSNKTILLGYQEGSQDIPYSIDYIVKATGKAVPGTTKHSGTGKVFEVVDIDHPTALGYKVIDGSTKSNFAISWIASENEKVVEYEVDKNQKFDYKVLYQNEAGDEIAASESGKLPVEDEFTATEKKIPGYKFKSAAPSKTIKITAAGPNEIIMTYEVDKDQKFPVEVNYFDMSNKKIATQETDMLPVETSFTATEKTITGYKFKSATPSKTIKVTAAGPNKIDMHYEVDPDQKFAWEIHFLNDDDKEIKTKKTGTLPMGSDLEVDPADKLVGAIPGYKYKYSLPLEKIEIDSDENNNIIEMIYEVDTNQKFPYEVKYENQKGDPINPSELGTASVETKITGFQRVITGYKFKEAKPSNPIEITAAGPNELTMVYEPNTDVKFEAKAIYVDENDKEIAPEETAKLPVTYDFLAPSKVIPGYNFKAADPSNPIEITAAGPNEIKMVYELDKSIPYDYTVKHINEKGREISTEETGKLTAGETLTGVAKTIPGYKFKSAAPSVSIIISAAGPNEIVMTYEVDKNQKFNYKVEYKSESGLQIASGESGTLPVEDEFTATEKIIPGYIFKEAKPSQKIEITAAGPNEIEMIYKIDPSQKFPVEAKYIDAAGAEIDAKVTDNLSVESDFTAPDKTIPGYKFKEAKPSKTIKVTAAGPNVIEMVYETDGNQKFDYTVKHINEKGREISTKETGKLAVGETLTGVAKTIPGYKFKSAAPSTSIIISAIGTNEIVMTYEVDKDQKFDYKVEYKSESGLQIASGESGTLPVDDEFTATEKIIPGYIFKEAKPSQKIEITAAGPNEIEMIYKIDPSQKFPVEAKYIDAAGAEIDAKVTDNLSVESDFTAPDKTIPGYKFKEAKPSKTIKVTAAGPNVIEMVYETDGNQKFDYTAKYVDGLGNEITSKETGKLALNSVYTAPEKAIPGYKFKEAKPNKSITISVAGPNEIEMIYEVDRDQQFDYEIRYYMEGTTTPALGIESVIKTGYNKATGKIVGKGHLNQEIPVTIPTGAQLANGYGPKSTDPTDILTSGKFKMSSDKSKNIINVYYALDKDVKFDYKINYYILDDKKSEVKNIDSVLTKNPANNEAYATKEFTGKGHLGEKITIQQPNISSLGYSLYKVESGLPTEMTLKAGVNEVDIYYVKDKNASAPYSITYVDENGDPIKDLAGNIQIQNITGTGRIDSKKVVPQPNLEGYKVEPGQKTMMTIIGDPTEDNIKIYYKKQQYKYEIRYLEVGSTNPIKLSPNKEEGTADYGEKIIAANAHDDLPSGGPVEYKIADRGQAKELVVTADETKNILNIYYIPEKVEITVSFYLKDTTTKIHTDVKFEKMTSTEKIGIGKEYSGTSILTAAKAIWGGNAVIPAYYKLQDGANKIKVTSSGMNISLFFRR